MFWLAKGSSWDLISKVIGERKGNGSRKSKGTVGLSSFHHLFAWYDTAEMLKWENVCLLTAGWGREFFSAHLEFAEPSLVAVLALAPAQPLNAIGLCPLLKTLQPAAGKQLAGVETPGMAGGAVPWWRTRWRGNREQGRLEGVGKWPESGGGVERRRISGGARNCNSPTPWFHRSMVD